MTYERPTEYWCNEDEQVRIIEAALDLYERFMNKPETVPTWIPCGERYPVDMEIVHVWGVREDGTWAWSIAQLDSDEGRWHFRIDGCDAELEEVTHWMPLPASPTPQEGTA